MTTTKTLSIEPARWQVGDEGELFAPLYDAVYANLSGVWGRAQSVFVEGCELPSRWQRDRCIRLLETGFGLGINFLTTWASIKASDSIARLQYVAIEKHPFTAQDLRSALQASVATAPASITPVLEGLVEQLIAQWPPLIPQCPDYWFMDPSSNCVNIRNLGTCSPQSGKKHLIMNFNTPAYTGSNGNCAKYTWANNCNVSWDGITYGVNNPCSS